MILSCKWVLMLVVSGTFDQLIAHGNRKMLKFCQIIQNNYLPWGFTNCQLESYLQFFFASSRPSQWETVSCSARWVFKDQHIDAQCIAAGEIYFIMVDIFLVHIWDPGSPWLKTSLIISGIQVCMSLHWFTRQSRFLKPGTQSRCCCRRGRLVY